MPHIIAYARASHAEYRVGIEKLVPFREHMGDERVEPIFLDFEMDVGGPHRAAVRGREHFSNSAVGRDWIAFGEVQDGRAECRERGCQYVRSSGVADGR